MAEVVHHKLPALEGIGGMIGVDGDGNVSMQFNSTGMYRACKTSAGEIKIAIYKED